MKITMVFIIAVLMLNVAGCGIQPWIKPYERQNLADPIMNPARDSVSASYIHHVHETRESSRGAGSVSGGGCGCN